LKTVIMANKEEVRRWRELVTIKRDVPLPVAASACRFRMDQRKLAAFFRKMEFRSLLGKVEEESSPKVEVGAVLTPETKVLKGDDLLAFVEGSAGRPLAVQFLATEATWQKGEVLGVALAQDQDQPAYLPLTGSGASWPAPLVRWLADGQAKKLAHDGKTQML